VQIWNERQDRHRQTGQRGSHRGGGGQEVRGQRVCLTGRLGSYHLPGWERRCCWKWCWMASRRHSFLWSKNIHCSKK
jgi:hypothetical protein